MKKKSLLLTLVILTFSVLTAQQNANDQKVLTLQKAMEIALDKNYTVKQAQNNMESAQTGVTAAYGNFLPTVSLGSSWSGGEQYVNGVPLGASNVRSFSPGLSARMTLFDGFNNTATLSRAVSTSASSEFILTRTRQSLVYRIQSNYYEVLRTERLVKVAEETVKYDVKQLDRVKETARLGASSIVNVYQQQAQLGLDEVALVQARNNYDIAKANLLADISVEVSEDYIIADPSIPEEIDRTELDRIAELSKDFPSLTREALDKRYDYLSAREQYNATEADVTSARSGYLPQISASLGYGWNGRTILESPGISYASEFSNFSNNRSYNWSLSFSLPLFSGFQTNNAVQSRLVAKKNAEEGLRDTERRIQVDVKNSLLLMQASLKSYEAAVNSLQLQNQNLKINQEKYNVGSGTILDLLLAQNNYNTALSNKINSVYQYFKAKSALELSLGRIKDTVIQ